MREALYQFIHTHYTVILSILPSALLLIGLLIAAGIDSYIHTNRHSGHSRRK